MFFLFFNSLQFEQWLVALLVVVLSLLVIRLDEIFFEAWAGDETEISATGMWLRSLFVPRKMAFNRMENDMESSDK